MTLNIITTLSRVHPFNGLAEDDLRILACCAQVEAFEPGAQIIEAGLPGDALYIISTGAVEVQTPGKRPRHLAWLTEGELFGEMALVTGRPREADVFADEATECIVIRRKSLYRTLRANPSAGALLTQLVGERLVGGKQITHVGKYQVLEQIGEGGTALVFAGYQPRLRRSVAIKMLKHTMVFDVDFADHFAKEATLIAQLEHPNIARVFDHENAYATQFIIMELVPGVTLTELMRAQPRQDEAAVRRVVLQLADALGYAHRKGIVHRDVKPDNVMVAPGQPIKLMDFGIARPMAEGTTDEAIIGTMPYMAPEQARPGPVDGRADLYALGMMAYELLTDDAPFADEDAVDCLEKRLSAPPPDVHAHRPGVSAVMAEFVRRACAPKVEDRFADCAEISAHFGQGSSILKGDVCARSVTVLYPPHEAQAVHDALDALSARLSEHNVLVSVGRHSPLND